MNPIKRLGLAVVLVVGVGLLGSTTAWAARTTTYSISFTNADDEPQASGAASFSVTKVTRNPGLGWLVVAYTGKLTVECANLTPGATYWTPAGTFIADATGAGSVTKKVTLAVVVLVESGYRQPCILDVVCLNSDDSATTALTGEFYGW